MALSLIQNGATIASGTTALTVYSGANDNAKTLVMSNGTSRLTFIYGVHNTSTYRWWVDLVEYSPDAGTTWLTALYGRDSPMLVVAGSGQIKATNALVTCLQNDTTAIKIQYQATQIFNSITYTQTYNFTVTAAQPGQIQIDSYVAGSAATTGLTSNQYVEDYGPCAFSAGQTGNCLAFFQGVIGPYNGTVPDNVLLTTAGNARNASPLIRKGTNLTSRGYVGGYSLYLLNGIQATAVMSPLSAQNLALNIHDSVTATNQWAAPQIYHNHAAYNNNFRTVDLAYQAQHDNMNTYFRLASAFGTSATTNFPQAVSNTDSATTLNLSWSLCLEKPTAVGTSQRLAIPKWLLPQAINKWTDLLYPRPNIGGTGIMGGGTGALWQSLPTLETTVQAELHTTSSYWSNTYGYQLFGADSTQFESYATALALRAALRYLNLGVGTGDASAFSDACAVVLANFQTQSGLQAGAINKVYNTSAGHYSGASTHFGCQDNANAHVTDVNQPHVAMYVQAEVMWALIEYYRARGNQTLVATYGSITVAAVLDAACAWLIKVVNPEGGWYTEITALNSYMASDTNIGAANSAGVTPDLAAAILVWCQYSASGSVAAWQKVGNRALNYWMEAKTTPNGGYEFGENHIDYSAHAVECCIRGFGRMYRLTGNSRYLEWLIYYVEIGFLLCKRVDDVINNSATQSQNLHTGGLISTISWAGVITGEAGNVWNTMMLEALTYHPALLAYHYFYVWASLAHMTWSYRDVATYNSSYAMANAFLTPFTTFATPTGPGVDNTRHGKHIGGAALQLLPTQTLVNSSNGLVLVVCLDAMHSVDKPIGRTISVSNPQSSTQVTTLTIRGMANKSAVQDGTPIASTVSGSDLLISSLSLTAGQVSKIVVR